MKWWEPRARKSSRIVLVGLKIWFFQQGPKALKLDSKSTNEMPQNLHEKKISEVDTPEYSKKGCECVASIATTMLKSSATSAGRCGKNQIFRPTRTILEDFLALGSHHLIHQGFSVTFYSLSAWFSWVEHGTIESFHPRECCFYKSSSRVSRQFPLKTYAHLI